MSESKISPTCEVALRWSEKNPSVLEEVCGKPTSHWYPIAGDTMALCAEHAKVHLKYSHEYVEAPVSHPAQADLEAKPLAEEDRYEVFLAWFVANYPSPSMLTNPEWHAQRIWKAAQL